VLKILKVSIVWVDKPIMEIRMSGNVLEVSYKRHGNSGGGGLGTLWLAKCPDEAVVDGVVYRTIPMYEDISVSATGIVRKRSTGGMLKTGILGSYLTVTIHNLVTGKLTSPPVHRLVAMAWCKNDDYVKRNIVDHIDSDKRNNSASNLRWVTASENTSYSVYSQLFRFSIIRMSDGSRVTRSSLRNVAKALDTSYKNLSLARLPMLITYKGVDCMIMDNTNPVDLSSAYLDAKYAFKVVKVHDTRELHYFKNKKDLHDKFKIPYANDSITITRKLLAKLGYRVVDIHGVTSHNEYDIKNLVTEKEHKGILLADVIRITKSGRSVVLTRLNKDYRYGQPMNGWLLKHSNEEGYTHVPVKPKVVYKVTKGDSVIENMSFRALARYFNTDRENLKRYINTSKTRNGYTITNCHL